MSMKSRHHPLALSLLAAWLLALVATPAASDDTAQTPQTLRGEVVVDIVAGLAHSCALIQSGRVLCWGANLFGQLGNGLTLAQLAPTEVRDLTNVVQIAAGGFSTCALRANGRVFCWGDNGNGQLGDGTTTGRNLPVRVVGLTDVTRIGVGTAHACALRTTGRVFCWGWNNQGQLGDGTTTSSPTPVRVEGPVSNRVTGIAVGIQHNCLLRDTGRVACWGFNSAGQLGDDTTTNRTNPVQVQGLTNVTQIAAGGHSCALRSTGRVFCWGPNGSGQLGDDTVTDRLTPVRVVGLTSVTQIAAGGHSCALRTSGRVFCWGSNSSGQLGNGSTIPNSRVPVRVNGMFMALQVTMGGSHTCGRRDDGRAYCWGSNGSGQLGNGTLTDSRSASRVWG